MVAQGQGVGLELGDSVAVRVEGPPPAPPSRLRDGRPEALREMVLEAVEEAEALAQPLAVGASAEGEAVEVGQGEAVRGVREGEEEAVEEGERLGEGEALGQALPVGEAEALALGLAEPHSEDEAEGVSAALGLVVATTGEAQGCAEAEGVPPSWLALGEAVEEVLREARPEAQAVAVAEREMEGERLRVGVPELLREPVKEALAVGATLPVALGEREGELGVLAEGVPLPLREPVAVTEGEREADGETLMLGLPLEEPLALGETVGV